MRKLRTVFDQNQVTPRFILTSLLVLLLIGTSFLIGWQAREIASVDFFQFPLARTVFTLLREQGIRPIPDKPAIEYGMIRGMLQAYNDPYTVFVEPPQAELQANQLQGKFGGIGIRLEKTAEGEILLYPLPDSPAFNEGLSDGDILIEVDRLKITPDTTMDAIQAAIRGPVGDPVDLLILRPPATSPLAFSVKRAEVPLPSVTYNLASFDSTIGVLQLNIVAESSADELVNGILDLKSRGAKRFILDLRNNGGGLVNSGADIVKLFMPTDDVFLFQQFKSEKVEEFRADSVGELASIPLVIVVNQNTASAAEIVAGALRQVRQVKLVGNRTFGKDSVQKVFELRDGSSLHVTSGKWWLPGLESGITGVGLPIDIRLTDEEAANAKALEKAAAALP